ncbi:MAG TPA: Lrp/AsnC family transcriptional regulator [Nitrososphaeraceae archaeon]|nr:Lrp/AsnC family transcriptional regulator [Nitrososphaeraceae archaeon]
MATSPVTSAPLQAEHLDNVDKELLNEIQWSFPLAQRPFLEISKRHNISEDEVIHKISCLKEMGLIRQINAIFDTRRLGYKSALIAFSVQAGKLENVAAQVNRHPGVSHNYERNHKYNMWFTLAVPPKENMKIALDKMAALDGVVKYRLLPTLKLYKIGVRLDMVNNDAEKPEPTDSVNDLKPTKVLLTEQDKDFVRELQRDLKLIPEPFNEGAKRLGVSVEELFARAKRYERNGVMRRFAAILRHRDAGFTANGMVVWNVSREKVDEVGYKIASFPQVSHCYQRPVYDDWPFNLFSMIHARTIEAAEKIAIQISNTVEIKDYRILFSSREFKKERVKYFEEDRINWNHNITPEPKSK